MEWPLDHRDVQAIMDALFDAHTKLDNILRYLYGDDDGEEEEEDLA